MATPFFQMFTPKQASIGEAHAPRAPQLQIHLETSEVLEVRSAPRNPVPAVPAPSDYATYTAGKNARLHQVPSKVTALPRPLQPTAQCFVSWCEARFYAPDTASFPLVNIFLESLEESNTPTWVIAAMGPALQQAHEAGLAEGECAASSEAFSHVINQIKRSVPAAIMLSCTTAFPRPIYTGNAPDADSLPLPSRPPATRSPGSTLSRTCLARRGVQEHGSSTALPQQPPLPRPSRLRQRKLNEKRCPPHVCTWPGDTQLPYPAASRQLSTRAGSEIL